MNRAILSAASKMNLAMPCDPLSLRERVGVRGFLNGFDAIDALTLALGNRSLRCPTSCIHAVVSRRERGLIRFGAIALCLMISILLYGSAVHAEQALDLQGATITGNRELPKVLYIVPWKKADPADLGGASPNMMDEVLAPVDREVFTRQLQYYDALHSRK